MIATDPKYKGVSKAMVAKYVDGVDHAHRHNLQRHVKSFPSNQVRPASQLQQSMPMIIENADEMFGISDSDDDFENIESLNELLQQDVDDDAEERKYYYNSCCN